MRFNWFWVSGFIFCCTDGHRHAEEEENKDGKPGVCVYTSAWRRELKLKKSYVHQNGMSLNCT